MQQSIVNEIDINKCECLCHENSKNGCENCVYGTYCDEMTTANVDGQTMTLQYLIQEVQSLKQQLEHVYDGIDAVFDYIDNLIEEKKNG